MGGANDTCLCEPGFCEQRICHIIGPMRELLQEYKNGRCVRCIVSNSSITTLNTPLSLSPTLQTRLADVCHARPILRHLSWLHGEHKLGSSTARKSTWTLLTFDQEISHFKRLMSVVADVIHTMHTNSFFHMGIQPNNILLNKCDNGKLKCTVGGYGQSVHIDHMTLPLTVTRHNYYPRALSPHQEFVIRHARETQVRMSNHILTTNVSTLVATKLAHIDNEADNAAKSAALLEFKRTIGECCDWTGFYFILTMFLEQFTPQEQEYLHGMGNMASALELTEQKAVNILADIGIFVTQNLSRNKRTTEEDVATCRLL